MHLKHEVSCGESGPKTLMLWNRNSDGLILRDARQHAMARVQRSGTQITSINMLGGGQRNSDVRFEFWQLLVERLFYHPTFGYICLPEPNPFRNQLRAIGISDTFIETVIVRRPSDACLDCLVSTAQCLATANNSLRPVSIARVA